jgi:predicted RNase H-like nuclease (RuvC/YqgF family)
MDCDCLVLGNCTGCHSELQEEPTPVEENMDLVNALYDAKREVQEYQSQVQSLTATISILAKRKEENEWTIANLRETIDQLINENRKLKGIA